MPGFQSIDDYRRFERGVTRETRYVHNQAVREFLEAVLDTSTARRRVLRKDRVLFRAQRGFTLRTLETEQIEVEDAHLPERMVPTAEYATDGRASVRGIPFLYLATTSRTAMAEVRPWVGSYVSLAQFKAMRDCSLIDCSSDERQSPWEFFDKESSEIDSKTKEAFAWGEIAYAFSKPVAMDEPHLDYVPTQILAEAFRSRGYDGIAYKSLLHAGGQNIALFDPTAADLMCCTLIKTKSVSFEFGQAGNTYYVAKHYPERFQDYPPTALMRLTVDLRQVGAADEDSEHGSAAGERPPPDREP